MNLTDLLAKITRLLGQHPDLEPKKPAKSLLTQLQKLIDNVEDGINAAQEARPHREEFIKFTEMDEDSIKDKLSNFSYDGLVEFCAANAIKSGAKTKDAKIKALKGGVLKRVKELKKQLA